MSIARNIHSILNVPAHGYSGCHTASRLAGPDLMQCFPGVVVGRETGAVRTVKKCLLSIRVPGI
ncbi:MAG: hypothetical protein V1932_01925 [Chloroflexota bacterium]